MMLIPSYRPSVVSAAADAIEFVMPAASSTLTDYVGYIDFADTTIQASSGFLSNLIAGAGNIRVYASDKTTEWCRHVNVVSANSSGQVWFKVPSYSNSGTTTFYMWVDTAKVADYGVTDTFGRNNTFSPLETFWHFEEDPSGTAPQLTDLTGNGRNGTSNGSMTGGDLITGKIGQAWDFDTNDYVSFGWNGITGTAARTYSFWFRMASKAGTDSLYNIIRNGVDSGAAGNEGKRFDVAIDRSTIVGNDGGLGIFVTGGSGKYGSGLDDNAWHHVVIQMDASALVSGIDVIIDGVLQANSANTRAINTTDVEFALARESAFAPTLYNYMGGDISLFGAASSNLGNDYATTEYSNQNNPAAFYDSITEVTF